MLQIYIFSDKENGFLDLLPGTVLDIEALQESFDIDITNGEFTLPIDIPWTDNNRRLLGFAERLENFHRAANTWVCTVYNKMYPELIKSKFTILGKKGNFNYRKGTFSASISGSKGIFGSAIKNKKLTDLTLGGTIEFTGMDSRQFAYSLATGGQPKYPYISFAPVAIEQFFDEKRKDFDGEFLAKDTVNTIVANENNWVFGRPSEANPTIACTPGAMGYTDYRTVPFFKMQYVLRECFLHFGFIVSGDFVDDPAFADMVIFNNHGIENYASRVRLDFNRRITPGNHMPDILIADWLKALFSLTSMFPVFEDNNHVRLVYHKTDISVKHIVAIDDFISGDFESEYLDGTATENGYKITYAWDSADSYFSERVKELTDKTLVATVATLSSLNMLNIGRVLTTDDIAFVECENMYYQVADATTTPIKWDAFSENLHEYNKGGGETTTDINMSTLCSYVELNTALALYERRNYVGCRQLGSYLNNQGVLVKNKFGLRVFYIKNLPIDGVILPVSFNHNKNAANDKVVPFSLGINGSDGLAAIFHIPWLNITENAELVKVKALGNEKVLHLLRNYNRFQIAGTLFLLKQIERSLPPTPTLKLQLVAL